MRTSSIVTKIQTGDMIRLWECPKCGLRFNSNGWNVSHIHDGEEFFCRLLGAGLTNQGDEPWQE